MRGPGPYVLRLGLVVFMLRLGLVVLVLGVLVLVVFVLGLGLVVLMLKLGLDTVRLEWDMVRLRVLQIGYQYTTQYAAGIGGVRRGGVGTKEARE